MTRLLKRLVEAGCARQADEGGYVVGQIIELAVRRINEDNAATAERLHALMEAVNPQPPPGGGRTDGEMFLGLRYLEELRAERKTYNANVRRLREEREGRQSYERTG